MLYPLHPLVRVILEGSSPDQGWAVGGCQVVLGGGGGGGNTVAGRNGRQGPPERVGPAEGDHGGQGSVGRGGTRGEPVRRRVRGVGSAVTNTLVR